jgi:dienelactone hydrolase
MESLREPGHRRWAACGIALGLFALLASSLAAAGQIIEQTIAVPVQIPMPGGLAVRQEIAVKIVREPGEARRPFLLLLHGRGVDPADRSAMSLQAYPANSRYFAAKGFVVLIPTRVGYGVSGGPDVEYTGTCEFKRFDEGVAAAVSETRQVLQYAERLAYLDPDRGIVMGESFGGLVAIAVAASDVRGVLAAVNFSGGDGGDVRRHIAEPCRPDQLAETFADYGRNNQRPTLWLYSSNDRFWGPVYPKEWFAAFTRAGGRGQFVALPKDKNNGHYIFNRNPPVWRPPVESFLGQLQTAGLPR